MPALGFRQRSRSRSVPTASMLLGSWNRKVNGVFEPWDPPSESIIATEIPFLKRETTTDEVHRWPRVKEGGPFKSVKLTCPWGLQGIGRYDTGTQLVNGYVQQYDGGFFPIWPFAGDSINSSQYTGNMFDADLLPDMSSYVPSVYPSLRPRLSSAGASVFIAELRDLPRMLRQTSRDFHRAWNTIRQADDFRFGASEERIRRLARSARMAPKRAADTFLNQQFGWVPFISDMNKFYHTFVNEAEKLSRLTRDNNTWIKRRKVHDDVHSDTVVLSGDGFKVYPFGFAVDRLCTPDAAGVRAKWQVRRVETIRVWSEGSFKYYRPEFDSMRADYSSTLSHLQRLLTLYGVRINPSVVYQATPWTWAIDYVTNIGDHIDRITDYGVDGVACRYAYLMHHRLTKLVFTQTLNTKSVGPLSMSWERLIDSKQREKADSPYGFTTPWDTLSPRQLAIAGALGISRTRW